MSKTKATFVTAVMTAMLLAILAFLLLLDVKFAFFGICGIFAVIGLVFADAWLLGWLSEKDDETEDLQLVEVTKEPEEPIIYTADEDFQKTYDEIRKELGGDEA